MARPLESIRRASDHDEHMQTFLLKLSNHTEAVDTFLSLLATLREAGLLQLVQQTVQARNDLLKVLIEQLHTEDGRRLLKNIIDLVGWLSTEEATRLIHLIGAVGQSLPDLPDAFDKKTASPRLTTALEEVASAKTSPAAHRMELEQKKSDKKHARSWGLLIRTLTDPEVRAGMIALLDIARIFGKQANGKSAQEHKSH